MALTFR